MEFLIWRLHLQNYFDLPLRCLACRRYIWNCVHGRSLSQSRFPSALGLRIFLVPLTPVRRSIFRRGIEEQQGSTLVKYYHQSLITLYLKYKMQFVEWSNRPSKSDCLNPDSWIWRIFKSFVYEPHYGSYFCRNRNLVRCDVVLEAKAVFLNRIIVM